MRSPPYAIGSASLIIIAPDGPEQSTDVKLYVSLAALHEMKKCCSVLTFLFSFTHAISKVSSAMRRLAGLTFRRGD